MVEPLVRAIDDDRRFLASLERCVRTSGLAVACYTSAAAFLDELESDRPGCLISDLRMPDMDGLALQQVLGERGIRIPIVFISAYGSAASAVHALKAGAVDFLEKPFREQRLLECVRQALATDSRDRQLNRERDNVRQRYGALSPRERQVFALVVSDRPNKVIARELRISPRTVEHHREHVMLKMQARSQAELITMAVLCGVHQLHL